MDRTPLHWAAAKTKRFVRDEDYINANKLLVFHGADVNAKDKRGRTPLHSAVLTNNLEAVKFLVSCGADVDVKDSGGKTPLDVAKEKSNTTVAKYLASIVAEPQS